MVYTDDILEMAKLVGINPTKGVSDDGGIYYYYNDSELQDYVGLPFFDEWDDLIKVVEKIESYGGEENLFYITGSVVKVFGETFNSGSKKKSVLDAIKFWIEKNK